ncbi:hypothetical protein V8D89_002942 [Ganoderma adspersum]
MFSLLGKYGPRLAHRTPDAAPVPALDDDPFINSRSPLALTLNSPSSLAQCTPANIAWTGGTPPYSLNASLTFEYKASSPAVQWGSPLSLANELTFVGVAWIINSSSPEPIPVESSGVQCELVFPPPVVGAAYAETPSPSDEFFVLLVCLLLRWSCLKTRRRDGLEEKQDATDGAGDGDGPSDRLVTITTNPFDDPENVVYTEHNLIASLLSNAGHSPSTYSPLTDPPVPRTGAIESAVDNSVTAKPLREEVTLRWERTPSVSTQSESDTETLSDTDAARLGSTTTLPPSYRTRGSSASVDVPTPDHQPFPPPLYALQLTGEPPSAFMPPVRRAP